jgi:hypothetical protein
MNIIAWLLPYGSIAAVLLALAACSPDPRGSMGGPARTAATVPTTTVDNPFFCPRRATP